MAEQAVKKRRSSPRPSILDHVRLSDGRLAWPLAQAAGMSEVTFRARLKRWGADRAISEPFQPVDKAARDERREARRKADAAYWQAREAARPARRAGSPWPAFLDVLHDAYSGVIWSDGATRLIVSPKGRFYQVQSKDQLGTWSGDFRGREASDIRQWLASIATHLPAGLFAAADQVPNDPSACEQVPAPKRS